MWLEQKIIEKEKNKFNTIESKEESKDDEIK